MRYIIIKFINKFIEQKLIKSSIIINDYIEFP